MMLLLLTAEGGAIPEPFNYLLNFGVAGIILVAVIVGWLWPSPAVKREQDARDRAEKQRDDLIALWEAKVLPLLETQAQQVVPALNSQQQQLSIILRELEELRRSQQ